MDQEAETSTDMGTVSTIIVALRHFFIGYHITEVWVYKSIFRGKKEGEKGGR